MNKITTSGWWKILRILIFLVLLSVILFIIGSYQDFFSDFRDYFQTHQEQWYLLAISILLFPLNWLLEALKWQYLVKPVEKISLFQSFKGVLSGVAFGFVTPHGIGDYIGRLLQLENNERLKAIGAVFLSRISQFTITLLLGSVAVFYLLYHTDPKWLQPELFWMILFIAANLFMLASYIFHQPILQFIGRIKLMKRIYPYIEIISRYENKELAWVLLLALVRYAVFAFQFYLLLIFFEVNESSLLMTMGVLFIFLAKSVVPTFFEIGIRESAAFFFFGLFSNVTEPIIFASLTLWAVNIVIPAILGSFLVLNTHLKNNNNVS